MIETEGFVSLWISNMQTAKELERLLAVSYTNEGDFIRSIFAKHCEICRYDDTVYLSEMLEVK